MLDEIAGVRRGDRVGRRRAGGAIARPSRISVAARTVSGAAARWQGYTPEHNGKVERYNRTLAEELLYARAWTSETGRADAITVWNIHYNYHRAHTAIGNRPPASRLRASVTNVMTQNT